MHVFVDNRAREHFVARILARACLPLPASASLLPILPERRIPGDDTTADSSAVVATRTPTAPDLANK
jgi:hypothetical protein